MLREWLEQQEDEEWLPLIEASRAEWRQQGGVEARQFFRQLQEEEAAAGALPR